MLLNDISKDKREYLIQYYLDKFKVNYKDPSNFIYRASYINDGMKEHFFTTDTDFEDYYNPTTRKTDFVGIWNLYYRFYNFKHIDASGWYANEIGSFPIYPNMKICKLSNNNLTSFPVQPRMTHCELASNRLTSFPIQPEMTHCNLSGNMKLRVFPIQPKLRSCEIDNIPKLPNEIKKYCKQVNKH